MWNFVQVLLLFLKLECIMLALFFIFVIISYWLFTMLRLTLKRSLSALLYTRELFKFIYIYIYMLYIFVILGQRLAMVLTQLSRAKGSLKNLKKNLNLCIIFAYNLKCAQATLNKRLNNSDLHKLSKSSAKVIVWIYLKIFSNICYSLVNTVFSYMCLTLPS